MDHRMLVFDAVESLLFMYFLLTSWGVLPLVSGTRKNVNTAPGLDMMVMT